MTTLFPEDERAAANLDNSALGALRDDEEARPHRNRGRQSLFQTALDYTLVALPEIGRQYGRQYMAAPGIGVSMPQMTYIGRSALTGVAEIGRHVERAGASILEPLVGVAGIAGADDDPDYYRPDLSDAERSRRLARDTRDASDYAERTTTEWDRSTDAMVNAIAPDPEGVDPVTGVLGGVARMLPPALIGGALGGPIGAATLSAGARAPTAYEEQIASGVDPETARMAAAIDAAYMGAMTLLPASVPVRGARFDPRAFALRAGSGVALNVPTGMAMRGSIASYLEGAGYSEQARNYDWLDATAIATDAILGAAFGGFMGEIRSSPGGAAETATIPALSAEEHIDASIRFSGGENPDPVMAYAHARVAALMGEPEGAARMAELVETHGPELAQAGDTVAAVMAVREGLVRPDRALVDDAMVARDVRHAEVDSAPGVPLNHAARAQHGRNLAQAHAQARAGEEINVGSFSEDAEFAPHADDVDAMQADIEYAREAIRRMPMRLTEWVRRQGEVRDARGRLVSRGGIADDRGDVAGDASDGLRGFASLLSPTGRRLDDLALSAWEQGFFPESAERPTINEFIDALNQDAREPGSVTNDLEGSYAARNAKQVLDFYESQGVDTAKSGDDLREDLARLASVERRTYDVMAEVLEDEGFADLARDIADERRRLGLSDDEPLFSLRGSNKLTRADVPKPARIVALDNISDRSVKDWRAWLERPGRIGPAPKVAMRIVELSFSTNANGDYLNPTEIATQMLREGFFKGKSVREAADLVDARRSLLRNPRGQDAPAIAFPPLPDREQYVTRKQTRLWDERNALDEEAYFLAMEGDGTQVRRRGGARSGPKAGSYQGLTLAAIAERQGRAIADVQRGIKRYEARLGDIEAERAAAAMSTSREAVFKEFSLLQPRAYDASDLVYLYNAGLIDAEIAAELERGSGVEINPGAIAVTATRVRTAIRRAMAVEGGVERLAEAMELTPDQLTDFVTRSGERRAVSLAGEARRLIANGVTEHADIVRGLLTWASANRIDDVNLYSLKVTASQARNAAGIAGSKHLLTEEQRVEIVALRKQGVGQTEIAERMGLRQSLVMSALVRARRRGEDFPALSARRSAQNLYGLSDDEPLFSARGRVGPPVREEVWNPPEGVRLSERERKIAEMAINGAGNAWIAEEMDVSVSNVKVTLNTVARKLGGASPWEGGKIGGGRDPAVPIERLVALRDRYRRLGYWEGRGKPPIGARSLTATIAAGTGMNPSAVYHALWRYDQRQSGEPQFSAGQSRGFFSVEDLQSFIASDLGLDWARASEALRLDIVPDAATLRQVMGDAGYNASQAPDGVQGVHLRGVGRTLLVADALNPEDVMPVLIHEIGYHHGMADMLGAKGMAELDRHLARLVREGHPLVMHAMEEAARASTIDNLAEEVGAYTVENAQRIMELAAQGRLSEAPPQLRAAALAKLIETSPDLPLVSRLLANLRQWLIRKFGTTFGMRLTVNDIRELAVASLNRALERGVRESQDVRVLGLPNAHAAELASAREQGYKGSDTGEAIEWLRAKAKGLDMSTEARMARAREMGFDTGLVLYVSTLEDLSAFRAYGNFYGNSGLGGIHLTDSPQMASRYLDRFGNRRYDGVEFQKNVMPVFLRRGIEREIKGRVYDGPQAVQGFPLPEGYVWPSTLDGVDTVVRRDSISSTGAVAHLTQEDMELLRALDNESDPTYKGPPITGTEYVTRDPRNIRSIHAAFDPDYSDSANLLASARGRPAPRSPFYSAVERALEQSTTQRASGAQWWATISKAPGVKKEELEWIGLEDWLKASDELPSPAASDNLPSVDDLKARGFTLELYHKTAGDFEEFRPFQHFGTAAQANMRAVGQGANVRPVLVRGTKWKRMRDTGSWRDADLRRLEREGYDGVVYLNRYEGVPLEEFESARERGIDVDSLPDSKFKKVIPSASESYIVFSPSNIRSRLSESRPARKPAGISRDDVLAFVRANGVRVEETVLGGNGVSPEVQRQLLPLIEERDRVQAAMMDGDNSAAIAAATQDARVQAAYRAFVEANKAADERLVDQRRLELRSEARDLNSRLAERISELEGERRKTDTKWSQYTLPGGKNYREVVVWSPDSVATQKMRARLQYLDDNRNNDSVWKPGDDTEAAVLRHELRGRDNRDSHYPEIKNPMGWFRANERITAEGARAFHVEEVQLSALLKEYNRIRRDINKNKATDAQRARLAEIEAMNIPFLNENSANTLLFKRIIRYAVEQAFDGQGAEVITWTPGQVQVERFKLANHIDEIRYATHGDGTYSVSVWKDGRNIDRAERLNASQQELRELVGAEMAQKIIAGEGRAMEDKTHAEFVARGRPVEVFEARRGSWHLRYESGQEMGSWPSRESAERAMQQQIDMLAEPPRRSLSGLDLKVGGEGMRAFYDRILVKIANDLGKKFGARVGEAEIGVPPPTKGMTTDQLAEALEGRERTTPLQVHALPITDAMREAAMEGQALFSARGGQNPPGGVGEVRAKSDPVSSPEYRAQVDALRASDPARQWDDAGAIPGDGQASAGEAARGLRARRGAIIQGVLARSGVRIVRTEGGVGMPSHRISIDAPFEIGGDLGAAIGAQRGESSGPTHIEFDFIDGNNPKDPRLPGVHLRLTRVNDALKGMGVGTWLYRQLIDWADRQGLSVYSDAIVSDQAQGVYARLEELGYKVEGPAPRRREGDGHITLSGRPMYVVKSYDVQDALPGAPMPRNDYAVDGPSLRDRIAQAQADDAAYSVSMNRAASMSDADVIAWGNENIAVTRNADGDEAYRMRSRDDAKRRDVELAWTDDGSGRIVGVTRWLGRTARPSDMARAPNAREVRRALQVFSRMLMATRVKLLRDRPQLLEFTGATGDHGKLYRFLLERLDLPGYRAFTWRNEYTSQYSDGRPLADETTDYFAFVREDQTERFLADYQATTQEGQSPNGNTFRSETSAPEEIGPGRDRGGDRASGAGMDAGGREDDALFSARRDYEKLGPVEQVLADSPNASVATARGAVSAREALRATERAEAEAKGMEQAFEAAVRCASRHGVGAVGGATGLAEAMAGHALGAVAGVPSSIGVSALIADARPPRGDKSSEYLVKHPGPSTRSSAEYGDYMGAPPTWEETAQFPEGYGLEPDDAPPEPEIDEGAAMIEAFSPLLEAPF